MKKKIYYPCDFDDNSEEDIPIWEMHRLFNKHVLIDADSLVVHQQLRLKRYADWFTQPELARKLGMGVSTLSDIENGKIEIPRRHLRAVENYLYRQQYIGGTLANLFDDFDDDDEVI